MWWILAWILAVAGLLAYLTDPLSLLATKPANLSETADVSGRVAVLFDAWVGSTPSDGGASVFAHLVQPLNADVFLALSHDARDGCTTQRRKCDAAAQLPARVSLDDVWQALNAMHSSDSDLIGLLHHLGYVRGLCSMTGLSERRRVKVLVRCATIAVHVGPGVDEWTAAAEGRGVAMWIALSIAALRVELLVLLLRVCALVLELWAAVLAAAS